jgi:hypothetical protein
MVQKLQRNGTMTNKYLSWLFVSMLVCFAPAATAQTHPHLGIRAGVSADPTQFVVGGHLETRPLIEHVTFRPNLEIGVGDRLSLVTVNLEFVYSIPISSRPWRVYFGAGPALILSRFHEGHPRRPDRSDVGGGFNALVGLQHTQGLFGEVKVGFIDSPGAKFVIGYAFR